MSTLASPYNGFNNYSRACRGASSPQPHCEAYGRNSDWVNLRKEASDAVLDEIAKWGAVFNELNIRKAIKEVVPCQKCTTRLFRTFKPAICEFAGNSSYGIGRWQGTVRDSKGRGRSYYVYDSDCDVYDGGSSDDDDWFTSVRDCVDSDCYFSD
jgi:hypothetical protein